MDKKKLHFLQLCFVFGTITILTLLYNWGYGYREESEMQMMGQTMGNMMSSMHLKNVTFGDLVRQEEQVESMTGMSDMSSHHEGTMDSIKVSHYVTTGTIIVLFPFILGGAVFLGILWLK